VIDLYVDTVHHRVLPDRTRVRAAIPLCTRADPTTHRCDPKGLTQPAVPVRFEGEPVAPDAELASLLAPWEQKVDALANRATGVQVSADLTRDYDAESPLGDVLADALRAAAHADVALLNGGGLRADLPAGPLTYGRLYEVLPFDNTVSTLTLTGAQLRALLDAAYAHRGGLFQQAGLRVTLSACQGPGRLEKVTLASGARLQPDKTYRVVMPDFLARGGAGLGEAIAELPPSSVDLGGALNVRDAILATLSKTPGALSAPAKGRIAVTPRTGACP
jgi:5'-nucleotidase